MLVVLLQKGKYACTESDHGGKNEVLKHFLCCQYKTQTVRITTLAFQRRESDTISIPHQQISKAAPQQPGKALPNFPLAMTGTGETNNQSQKRYDQMSQQFRKVSLQQTSNTKMFAVTQHTFFMRKYLFFLLFIFLASEIHILEFLILHQKDKSVFACQYWPTVNFFSYVGYRVPISSLTSQLFLSSFTYVDSILMILYLQFKVYSLVTFHGHM